jgi:multimeric flavodoxin WrbA
MRVLAVNGSPRKEGNTFLLLKKALEPLASAGWETELVQLADYRLEGCTGCMGCFATGDGRCVGRPDDDFAALFERILSADALVLGSPCYFASITAELKALIDRVGLVAMAGGGLLRGKIGAAVVAQRRGGATHAFDTINHLFQISQMIVPGSTYWNFGVGLEAGDVCSDDEGNANMAHLGAVIAWLGKAIGPHRDAYPTAAP